MTNQPPYQPFQQQQYPQPYPQQHPQVGDPSVPYASWYAAGAILHSGLGVASFIMGVVVAVTEVCLLVFAAIQVQQKTPSNTPPMEIAGCAMFLGLAVCVVGALLGIIGMIQPDRKKLFAILGLSINGLILLGVVGLLAIGLLMK